MLGLALTAHFIYGVSLMREGGVDGLQILGGRLKSFYDWKILYSSTDTLEDD